MGVKDLLSSFLFLASILQFLNCVFVRVFVYWSVKRRASALAPQVS